MKLFSVKLYLILTILLISAAALSKEEWIRLVELRGEWKFEIGDNLDWARPGFDDSAWENIFVPSSWEDEGFPGYDGFAWYRKRFNFSPGERKNAFYLFLGRVDDADEVYLNGHLIGFSGVFPPGSETAYYKERRYLISPEYLSPEGENMVAVRVYDHQLAGGILEGRVGIYELISDLNLEISLEGIWKFSAGSNSEWKEPDFDDSDWKNMLVPARWELQGYRDYDGYAWYRKSFHLPATYRNQDLILILGKIDDLDETYLNGELIGKTGRMEGFGGPVIKGDEWQQIRAYQIPSASLRYGGENILAVRVYDGLIDGGIYEGPLGIVPADRFRQWQAARKKDKSFWDYFEAWIKN